ncbi:hypothetical protein [Flavisolibacter nicotianae]|uniref:hypothetical protein n=1 Tax=Flavisolibacter nicotianae TaxID=2364882 RepID=UPI000EB0A7D3|nr:hypothetical protein [Flavisolibacter nicotianae]
MSEIHSVPPASERMIREAERKLVNTNAIFKKALAQFSKDLRKGIALRCDDLPAVQGAEADFEAVFSLLLQTILQRRANVSRLFLHVHCTSEDIDTDNAAGLKQFSIQFNTNISPCADWLQQNEQQLTNVAAILLRNGGRLLVNQLKTTGCIFSVSLPGKTL